jgi:hypothetical protein
MAFANASSLLKQPTMLEQLLEEINFQRTKEMRQLLKDGKWCLQSLCSEVEGRLCTFNDGQLYVNIRMCLQSSVFLCAFS